ncbi:hypothetical protein WAI453_006414 [Rhynchosporium graminicola]
MFLLRIKLNTLPSLVPPLLYTPEQQTALYSSNSDSDIVSTHGIYLTTRPRTPVFHGIYNDEFVSTLKSELNHIVTQQIWRRRKYRDAADE